MENGDEKVDRQMTPGETPGPEMDGDPKAPSNYNTSLLEPDSLDKDLSPIEQVNLTVPITDDPSMPVLTFRCWVLGILSCILLAFLNQFFSFRTEPLTVGPLTAQILAMPLGRLMAATLPTRVFFKGSMFAFSLNSGPFNVKEHVLITIFANTAWNNPYAIYIVTIVKVFYKKNLTFIASLLLTITTQIIGYGWAGLFRNFLVKPGVMWWPQNLVQVALFRTLHEKDRRPKHGFTRLQFFILGMTCSFAWYLLPGFLFQMLTSLSWICWVFPQSVLAQQLGSGMTGLGIGTIGFDWSLVSNSFLLSPLATPWFAIANIGVGYFLIVYVMTPIAYWSNIYNAKSFPIVGSSLFLSNGTQYDVTAIIDPDTFSLDIAQYDAYGKVHIPIFFAFTYGVGFAVLTATLSHVALFYGKDIWILTTQAAKSNKEDVHTRLMRAYREVPMWWYHLLLILSIALAIFAVEVYSKQLQLPWWGVLFACGLACFFTLPIGIITATTNQQPGLNVITEYIIGYAYPGRPVANVCFKTYGYISMVQAVNFLQDFKLGHYMKVPPISMFIVQLVGTVLSAVVSLATTWWLITSINNICLIELLPRGSPWTCPSENVFYSASVLWGLVGPKRVFGSLGIYKQINWGFLLGAVAPIPVWIATKMWPRSGFLRAINMPVLIGATASMPPATAANYTSWLVWGFIFQFLIFRYRKAWWSRYNYVLSAALDTGLAFMGVALYFALQLWNVKINWWGGIADNCPLSNCPTQPGLPQVLGCPPT